MYRNLSRTFAVIVSVPCAGTVDIPPLYKPPVSEPFNDALASAAGDGGTRTWCLADDEALDGDIRRGGRRRREQDARRLQPRSLRNGRGARCREPACICRHSTGVEVGRRYD